MSMDRRIEKKRMPLGQWGLIGLAVLLAGWLLMRLIADASIRTYLVPAEQVSIGQVEFGAFEDLIPIRGTVQPFNSVFLDAVHGGVVEEIFVEEGSFVETGLPLLQFSNSDLQLSVARNDTTITEQLNNLSNITNQLETTKINTQRQIIDVEYRIITLERLEKRQQVLITDNLIRQDEYDATLDELDYQRRVLDNLQTRQALEDQIREDRLKQIEVQMAKLEDNLAVSQSSFENLLVRAPIAGQLTSFPVDIGESKIQGQRLGQVDVVDRYKLVAQIDEFYVSRVAQGQGARITLAGTDYTAVVSKVYPEITEGTFTVDLVFEGREPGAIRRGQTIQMNLILGSPAQSLLLPVGSFVQNTGGNWAFVLDEAGEYAIRRDIRTGRRNNRYIEIQEGLQEGDRVITSSYSGMTDMARIQLER